MDPERFLMNPTNRTDPVSTETVFSPLSSILGLRGVTTIKTIQRSRTLAPTRSPWEIKNLTKRVDHQWALETVQEVFSAVRVWRFSIMPSFMITHTLADILTERYRNQLGPLEAVLANKVACSVLRSLQYLHDTLHIVHGDLKSFHILVDEGFGTVKVGGFGDRSKKITQDGTLNRPSYPDIGESVEVGLWSAPEVLKNERNITEHADMFSFGMVIYEMLSCMPPHTFPGIKDDCIQEPETLLQTYKTCYALRDALKPKTEYRGSARMSTAPGPPHLTQKLLAAKRKQRELRFAERNRNAKLVTPSADKENVNTAQEPVPKTSKQEQKPCSTATASTSTATRGQPTSTAPCANAAAQTVSAPYGEPDCLNYACLGTRPLLPNIEALGIDYRLLVDIFYVCTEEVSFMRPTAGRILGVDMVEAEFRDYY